MNYICQRLSQKIVSTESSILPKEITQNIIEHVIEEICDQILQRNICKNNISAPSPTQNELKQLSNYSPFVDEIVEMTANDVAECIKLYGFIKPTSQHMNSLDILYNAEHLYKVAANDIVASVIEEVWDEVELILKDIFIKND